MAVSFFVPGKPVGKGRPRGGKSWSGKPVFYTPGKTIDYEKKVADLARPLFTAPFDKEVAMFVGIKWVVFPPKSWSKKKRREALEGNFLPLITPDIDNVLKAVLDSMNDIAYIDDKQVALSLQGKVYGDEDGVHVLVQPIDERVSELLNFM